MTRWAGRIAVVAMAIVALLRGRGSGILRSRRERSSGARVAERPRPLPASRPPRRGRRQRLLRTATRAGFAHCDAHVRTDLFDKGVRPHRRVPVRPGGVVNNAFVGNNGAYDPAFLQSAYNTPSATNGVGQTVAIVDAYDAPNVESDLARVPIVVRAAAVHDRQRLLHEGRPERRHQLPDVQSAVGAGDRRSTCRW